MRHESHQQPYPIISPFLGVSSHEHVAEAISPREGRDIVDPIPNFDGNVTTSN